METLFLFLVLNLATVAFLVAQEHIPTELRVDWTNAGLLPETPTKCTTVINIQNTPGQDFDAQLKIAVEKARKLAGLTIIYIPPGTYLMRKTLELNTEDSGIVFQGAGAAKTRIHIRVGTTEAGFKFYGRRVGEQFPIDTTWSKGSASIQVQVKDKLDAGDWVHVCEEKLDDGYNKAGDTSGGYVGQISRIRNVTHIGVILTDAAAKDYQPENKLWLQKLDPVQNIGIENIGFVREDLRAKSGDGNNIRMYVAVNCWIKGCEFNLTARHHINIQKSAHIYIAGNYIHRARHYDVGSYGCGVVLGSSTSNCLIENNVFRRLRHAMLAGTGACCNVFTFNFSTEQHATLYGFPYWDSDVNLHGRYPFANLFEHNNVHYIEADDTHGYNGPYNTYVRNIVRGFKYGLPSRISIDHTRQVNIVGNEFRRTFFSWVTSTNSKGEIKTNIYGRIKDRILSHKEAYQIRDRMREITNKDTSYFYSSKPAFLSAEFTWPAIGPSSKATSQAIPAEKRFKQEDKTYNTTPTKWPEESDSID